MPKGMVIVTPMNSNSMNSNGDEQYLVVANDFDTCYEDNAIVSSKEEVYEEATWDIIEYSPYISLHALNGVESFQTMRVTGHVGKHHLHILIDIGSIPMTSNNVTL
uniref:Reverse transcriptase n=1 Tax=Tanacetum cinerariifolium TaxID=118510 RepID=A0A699HSG4_TANCI|nr:reverse transcriptase [Tanacetum cinerariifolium]